MATRAMVVEDDDFTRLMIVTALRSQGIDVVLETAEASTALEQAKSADIDVALLDLQLGKGPTGIDLAVALRRDAPKLGILFLTSYEDPRLLNPNLPELPFGSVYLNKKSISEIETLLEAINLAKQPRAVVAKRVSKTKTGPIASLTDTQLETLRLMAQGLSNAEIAKRRYVTEKSVETSIARLAKTMGLVQDPTKNQRVHMAKVYFRALGSNPGEDD